MVFFCTDISFVSKSVATKKTNKFHSTSTFYFQLNLFSLFISVYWEEKIGPIVCLTVFIFPSFECSISMDYELKHVWFSNCIAFNSIEIIYISSCKFCGIHFSYKILNWNNMKSQQYCDPLIFFRIFLHFSEADHLTMFFSMQIPIKIDFFIQLTIVLF